MNRNATVDASFIKPTVDTSKTHSHWLPFAVNHSKMDYPHRLRSIQSQKQSTGGRKNSLKTISTNEFSLKTIIHGKMYKMILFTVRLFSRSPTLEPHTTNVDSWLFALPLRFINMKYVNFSFGWHWFQATPKITTSNKLSAHCLPMGTQRGNEYHISE